MQLTYSLTLTDYQAAQRLHWRQTLSRRAISFFVYWLLPSSIFPLLLLYGRVEGAFLINHTIGYVLLYGFIFGLAGRCLLPFVSKPAMFKKHFERKFPPGQRDALITIVADGVTSVIVGTDSEIIRWDKFVGFAQDDKMALLYIAKNQFLFFPTHSMTASQRTELNDLVARHLPKGTK
jgi:hypothetical protein